MPGGFLATDGLLLHRTRSMSPVNPASWAAAAVAAVCFALLYAPVVSRLVSDWVNDDNYSHGFFIVPLAAYFAWERRGALKALPWRPSFAGVSVVVAGLGLLVAGMLGAELFLSRVSIIVVAAGAIAFVVGWPHVKVLMAPLLFLLLMIPIPAIIFNQIAFPLQLIASRFGETVLSTAGIPVLREGNVIVLAHTTLEVAEACSGIRSLITLLTLSTVYGHFVDPRGWFRLALALSTVPIAIVANGLRVAGTGIAAHYFGPAAAEGFFHSFSGWVVFVVAFALLIIVAKLLLRLGRAATPRPPASVPVAVGSE